MEWRDALFVAGSASALSNDAFDPRLAIALELFEGALVVPGCVTQHFREVHRIFQRHRSTLAGVWTHRMRCIPDEDHAPVMPSRKRLDVVHVQLDGWSCV